MVRLSRALKDNTVCAATFVSLIALVACGGSDGNDATETDTARLAGEPGTMDPDSTVTPGTTPSGEEDPLLGTPLRPAGTEGAFVEDRGEACVIPPLPTSAELQTISTLPDPFLGLNGERITEKAQWQCRREEIRQLGETFLYGKKPGKPESVTGTVSDTSITVNVQSPSGSATFSATVSLPPGVTGPVPAIIGLGGSAFQPTISEEGVAFINYGFTDVGDETTNNPKQGAFYTVNPERQDTGMLIAWAWGLSRIIDGLELCPEAGIDLKAIAVTGCSRNGKGALAMGAFDERVALTLMQEGGSGGSAAWRISEAEKKAGQKIQESSEIVGEANWQGADFKQYANGMNSKLSADQHFAVALCAPRAVLLLENDIDWLGPLAAYGGGIAGQMVFEALGIKERCGVSVAPNHGHCTFPTGQQKHLDAFVNRFLKRTTTTNMVVDELNATNSTLKKFDKATWIDWDIPTLSGSLAWDPFAT